MRAYLWRREEGFHATLRADKDSRTYSLHRYTDEDGNPKDLFFETTGSFGREEDDFREFLQDSKLATA